MTQPVLGTGEVPGDVPLRGGRGEEAGGVQDHRQQHHGGASGWLGVSQESLGQLTEYDDPDISV